VINVRKTTDEKTVKDVYKLQSKFKLSAEKTQQQGDVIEIRGDLATEEPKTVNPQSVTETESPQEKADLEAFKQIAQPGDVLLCKPRDKTTVFVFIEEVAFNSPWDHAAMYDGNGFVLHALTDKGVVKEPLDAVFKEFKVNIYRPQYKSEQAQEKALKFMESQLGHGYDSKFDLTSNREHYCTELVYKAILESFVEDNKIPPKKQEEGFSYIKTSTGLIKEIIKEKIYGDEHVDNYLKEYRAKLKDNGYVMDQLPIEPLAGKKVLTPMTFKYSPLLKQVDVPDNVNYYWSMKKEELKTHILIKVLQHVFRTHKHIEQMAAQWGGASGVVAEQIAAK
jgi:hypothetical protein